MEKNYTAIISVTKDCPLRCKYCYVHTKTNHKISVELAQRIIDELFTVNKCPIQEIIWHGGEPLLMGISFYQAICDYLNEKYPAKRIHHKLQTSGILINQEWVEFFKRNHFEVGISLDGPKFIHDQQRLDKGMKPTFDRVINAINLMEKEGLKPGFIAVITKNSVKYPKEIFDFFYENNWQFSFAKVSIGEDCIEDLSITTDEYIGFYEAMLDCFLSQSEFRLKVVPIFHHIMSFLKGTSVGLCVHEPNCAENYLSFSPDGEVYNCNRFIDYPTESFGNIMQQPLAEILNSAKRKQFAKRKEELDVVCKDCKYYPICHGGCPNEQFVSSGSIMGKDSECIFYSRIFPMLETRLCKEVQ